MCVCVCICVYAYIIFILTCIRLDVGPFIPPSFNILLYFINHICIYVCVYIYVYLIFIFIFTCVIFIDMIYVYIYHTVFPLAMGAPRETENCFFFGYFYYRKQSSKNKVLPSRTPVSFSFFFLSVTLIFLSLSPCLWTFFSFFLFFFYCRELSGGKLAAAEVAGCSAVGTRHYAKPCALAYSQEGVLYRMCSL